ncbi:MAG: response regulator [Candidatus Colwellbacteria bacterium]|nr:response regulator [Candidatus Colwellbacteria bacterium]
MKIFIVEDEAALADALDDKFKHEGYQTKVVYEGGSAFKAAKEFKPDIVLLDLLLPKKGGYEVLKEIKDDEELKSVPVIILSNLDTDEDIKKSMALGAADYFVKSNHPLKEVIEKVKTQLLKAK